MNNAELRYEIYKFLAGRVPDSGAIKWVGLDSPEPGRPLRLTVGIDDGYSTPPRITEYAITIEETKEK